MVQAASDLRRIGRSHNPHTGRAPDHDSGGRRQTTHTPTGTTMKGRSVLVASLVLVATMALVSTAGAIGSSAKALEALMQRPVVRGVGRRLAGTASSNPSSTPRKPVPAPRTVAAAGWTPWRPRTPGCGSWSCSTPTRSHGAPPRRSPTATMWTDGACRHSGPSRWSVLHTPRRRTTVSHQAGLSPVALSVVRGAWL